MAKGSTEKTISDVDMGALLNDVLEKCKYFKIKNDDSIYAMYDVNGKTELKNIRSERFKLWLCHETKLTTRECNRLTERLMSEITFDPKTPTSEIFNRVGAWEGKVYIDLGNSNHEVIEVSEKGYRVILEGEAPILFNRRPDMEPLPKPEKGGTISDLRQFINVNDEDFMLVVGWLLAALNPMIQCPILWMNAERGRGKTTATSFLKMLIDPDTTGAITPFDNVDGCYAASASRHIIAYDNSSSISKRWEDILCRLVTGIGVTRRKKYTDNTVTEFRLRNPLIINGINLEPESPDLLDRTYLITLKKLDEATRKTEVQLKDAFIAARPKILGSILDALVSSLKGENCAPKKDVRMLDAACSILRAAKAGKLPFTAEEFEELLMKQKRQSEEISADPLEEVICSIVDDEYFSDDVQEAEVWSGPTRELLQFLLSKVMPKEKRMLPGDPKVFGKRIFNEEFREKMAATHGIKIKRDRDKKDRKIRIFYAPSLIEAPVTEGHISVEAGTES